MAKWSKYDNYILENSDLGARTIARAIVDNDNLDPSKLNAIRRYVQRLRQKSQDNSALEAYCEANGLPVSKVSGYWHKGEHNGVNMSVRVTEDEGEGISLEDLKDSIAEVMENYSPLEVKANDIAGENALKVVISDAHVGLEPNPQGNSLFEYEYSADIFLENLDKVYNSVINEFKNHGVFELFILDDLGDGLDGFNGQTTRGGHDLPQNLSNKEAFDTYVKGKYQLIRRIMEAGVAKKYVIRNVSNCNHAGDFGWVANRAIQYMIELSVKGDIEYIILDKFMEHFTWGDHAFLLTHGKDKSYMKRGLPFVLNDAAVNFLTDYIDHYNINSKYIHVEKGDLHQVGYQRTKKFDYRNYMSFAPPSAWQQHNFGDAYSGYAVQIVPKWNNLIKHTDVFLELKKKSLY
jgi:hypothetical protein